MGVLSKPATTSEAIRNESLNFMNEIEMLLRKEPCKKQRSDVAAAVGGGGGDGVAPIPTGGTATDGGGGAAANGGATSGGAAAGDGAATGGGAAVAPAAGHDTHALLGVPDAGGATAGPAAGGGAAVAHAAGHGTHGLIGVHDAGGGAAAADAADGAPAADFGDGGAAVGGGAGFGVGIPAGNYQLPALPPLPPLDEHGHRDQWTRPTDHQHKKNLRAMFSFVYGVKYLPQSEPSTQNKPPPLLRQISGALQGENPYDWCGMLHTRLRLFKKQRGLASISNIYDIVNPASQNDINMTKEFLYDFAMFIIEHGLRHEDADRIGMPGFVVEIWVMKFIQILNTLPQKVTKSANFSQMS